MQTDRIRILCVDDHRLVREGIALIINRQPDMQVVGLAESGEQAVELFERERPDVTLMDLQLRQMSGVEAIRAIRQKDSAARIIVLTMYQGDEDIYRAVEAGAATYLLKDTLADDLVRVVREVSAGRIPPISGEVAARLAERSSHPQLTSREIEVLKLMSLGMQNKEISSSLSISEATVQVHIKNIFAKLDVRHRTAAINIALRRGIIHIP